MEVLAGVGDFLVKIGPVIIGLLIFIIPTAKDRLDRNAETQEIVSVEQGRAVDYTRDYVLLLQEHGDLEVEVAELRFLLEKHGIEYKKKDEES